MWCVKKDKEEIDQLFSVEHCIYYMEQKHGLYEKNGMKDNH